MLHYADVKQVFHILVLEKLSKHKDSNAVRLQEVFVLLGYLCHCQIALKDVAQGDLLFCQWAILRHEDTESHLDEVLVCGPKPIVVRFDDNRAVAWSSVAADDASQAELHQGGEPVVHNGPVALH